MPSHGKIQVGDRDLEEPLRIVLLHLDEAERSPRQRAFPGDTLNKQDYIDGDGKFQAKIFRSQYTISYNIYTVYSIFVLFYFTVFGFTLLIIFYDTTFSRS